MTACSSSSNSSRRRDPIGEHWSEAFNEPVSVVVLRGRFFFALLLTLPAGAIRREPVSLLVGTGVLGLLLFGLAVSVLRLVRGQKQELIVSFDPPLVSRNESSTVTVRWREGRPRPGTVLTAVLRSGSREQPVRVVLDQSAPGEELFRYELPLLSRGLYRPEETRLVVPDPLGISFFLPRCTISESTLRVTPLARPVRIGVPRDGRGSSPDLPAATLERAGERVDVRPYVPGDDMSRINWKVYAHTGELFFRIPEELPPPSGAILIVVDALQRDERVLDQVIECALGLAELLLRAGSRVVMGARVRGDAGGRAGADRGAGVENSAGADRGAAVSAVTVPVGPPDQARLALAGLDHRYGLSESGEWSRDVVRPGGVAESSVFLVTTGLSGVAPEQLRGEWVILVREEGGTGAGGAGAAQRLAPLNRHG